MTRPSQRLRVALAAAVGIATLAALYLLFGLADAAVDAWLRLRELPGWIGLLFGGVALALVVGSGWLIWRLLRPAPRRTIESAPVDRATIVERLAALPEPAPALSAELDALDHRAASGDLHVALFGEISSGKSSLLCALAPEAEVEVGVVGGTTRRVTLHRGTLPDGRALVVADVPGLGEAGGEARAVMAQDEVARAHALVFVADGDLTRSQDAALQPLLASARPLVLALNKSDRYRDDERAALLARLRSRYAAPQVRICAVSAGFEEAITRRLPDGREESATRLRPAEIAGLQSALARIADIGAKALEPGRASATVQRLDARLDAVEAARRDREAAACVTRYTRRAVVGALAAVAPGTDLLIQGALATGMVRELCQLHGLKARDIDLDALLARAGGTVRSSTAITLAIAGNALKAFPGAGTLGGGLVHALAYGLIFDALGRAVAVTLAETRRFDREATLQRFTAELQAPAGDRLAALATLAWDAARGGHAASTADEGRSVDAR